MNSKRHGLVLAATLIAVAMAVNPAFAEESATAKEHVKKEDTHAKASAPAKDHAQAKESAQAKDHAPAKVSTQEKAKPAVKKAKVAAKKAGAKPVEAKVVEKQPQPTTPVTGGGAESTANSAKKGEPEVSSVAPAPLPYVTRKVSALVESSPSNCDIEVDGVYVGSTPVELQLKEGVHGMKVSRSGFIAWEKTVKAYNGIFIHATLTQESSRKFEVSETVKAK
jgi:hypothetical protein